MRNLTLTLTLIFSAVSLAKCGHHHKEKCDAIYAVTDMQETAQDMRATMDLQSIPDLTCEVHCDATATCMLIPGWVCPTPGGCCVRNDL